MIAAPLPDVAMHVVDPPRIGLLSADAEGLPQDAGTGHWRSPFRGPVPRVVRENVEVVTEAEQPRRPRPAGMFPLRLSRQRIAPAGGDPARLTFLPGELRAKADGVFPAHPRGGKVVAGDPVPAPRFSPHHPLPF